MRAKGLPGTFDIVTVLTGWDAIYTDENGARFREPVLLAVSRSGKTGSAMIRPYEWRDGRWQRADAWPNFVGYQKGA